MTFTIIDQKVEVIADAMAEDEDGNIVPRVTHRYTATYEMLRFDGFDPKAESAPWRTKIIAKTNLNFAPQLEDNGEYLDRKDVTISKSPGSKNDTILVSVEFVGKFPNELSSFEDEEDHTPLPWDGYPLGRPDDD